MRFASPFFVAAALACAPAVPVLAQRVDIGTGSVAQVVASLRAGQYVWAPQVAPKGPLFLIVNTRTQRAVLFRNGVPVGASTISTGRPGYRTPTGVFTVLQKQVKHYSSKYDSAPMPYMQRLTWYGVALHAGHLPGYAASHGCIRMPLGFARLLYGVTTLGMTVVITDHATQPRIAPTPQIIASSNEEQAMPASEVEWDPARSPTGPVSIIVSVADTRAVVLRNGVKIGSARVAVDGPVSGTSAYALRSIENGKQQWIRVQLSSTGEGGEVPPSEWQKFRAPDEFRHDVAAIVQPGTTIIVTPDSLRSGAVAAPVMVIEGGPKAD